MRIHARSIAAALGAGMLVVACGGSATVETPTATPTATTTATATAASTTASAGTWTVTDKSKATIRVREQLVGVSLPSDAVFTAMGAKGSFELNADGTFESGSITFDLTTLSRDVSDRVNFIK